MGPNDDERWLRVLARVTAGGDVEPTLARMCGVGVEMTAMSGAAISLMAGDRPRGALWSTDGVSAAIDELEFTLGEGPCIDAHHDGVPVLAPDLQRQPAPRWPAFSPAALSVGACRVRVPHCGGDHPAGRPEPLPGSARPAVRGGARQCAGGGGRIGPGADRARRHPGRYIRAHLRIGISSWDSGPGRVR